MTPIRFGLAALLLAMTLLGYFLAFPLMREVLAIIAAVAAALALLILVQSPFVWLLARKAAKDETDTSSDDE